MRKMKDSGIEWIGEIPEEWEIRKLSSIANTITDFVASGSFASLNENVKYLDIPDYAMLVRAVDLSNKSNIKPIYINKHAYNFLSNSNLFGGEIILPNIGSVGDVYMYKPLYTYSSLAPNSIMLRMKDSNKFYYYWFLNPSTNDTLKRIGSDSIQKKFNKTQLRQLLAVKPPIEEQEIIVDYLDSKVSQIDNIILKTKETIEEYKKYKQSVITEAVTKGLNPNVEMKDSGIEWIGEIPKHWEIVKLKNIGTCFGGVTYSPENITDEINGRLVLRSSNVQNGKLTFNDNVYINLDINEKYIVKKGDILVCSRNGSRNLIGKNAIIENNYDYTFGAFMTIVRTKNYNYVYYFLNSDIFKSQSSLYLTSTINQLTLGVFNNFKLCLPSKEEQKQIVTYLNKKCNEIDKLISKKEDLITELEQYKKSLIYECVTGKKEVSVSYAY